jgi:hypothetical protein
MDAAHHVVHDYYRLFVFDDQAMIDEITEVHTMRFFFPMELQRILSQSGFDVVSIDPFPDSGGSVDETTWNIKIVACARGSR